MDVLQTWAILPQSIYPLDLRSSTISHLGGDIYGSTTLPRKLGTVSYTAYRGRRPRTLVFTGTGAMPKFLDSDAEIVHYVASTKGAIGYVSSDFPSDGVKVLTTSQTAANAERKLLTRVEPEYPETLVRLQIGGTARLIVTISPKGNVDGVQRLGGNPILAESAIQAVKQWVYAPSPSRTTREVSIPFVPKN